jgi:hypothetical protein
MSHNQEFSSFRPAFAVAKFRRGSNSRFTLHDLCGMDMNFQSVDFCFILPWPYYEVLASNRASSLDCCLALRAAGVLSISSPHRCTMDSESCRTCRWTLHRSRHLEVALHCLSPLSFVNAVRPGGPTISAALRPANVRRQSFHSAGRLHMKWWQKTAASVFSGEFQGCRAGRLPWFRQGYDKSMCWKRGADIADIWLQCSCFWVVCELAYNIWWIKFIKTMTSWAGV